MRDYDIALQQAQADVITSEAELLIERGNRAVAERELTLLGEDIPQADRALVLREPQLAAAEARIANAAARVVQAELNHERTTISAPFAGVVAETQVDLGARLNAGAPIAQFIGSDTFWIEVLLRQNELHWLRAA